MKHFSKGPRVLIPILMLGGLLGPAFPLEGAENLSRQEKVARISGTRGEARPSLDIGSLRNEGMSLEEARNQAGVILNQLLLDGGAYEAVHIVTYARLTNDSALSGAIRQRLQKSDSSWTEQHVKLGALHALVVLNGEKFPKQINEFLLSDDESLRVRAYMLARDSKDSSLLAAVRQRVAQESDAAVKIAGLSAMAAIEGHSSTAYSELVQASESTGRESVRAQLEIEEITHGKEDDEEILTREAEERLKMMAVSKQHDQRMYGIEMIAAKGSESAQGWLRRMGESEDWHQRLNSAYFLLQSADAKEAQIRLLSETHPLVQITLLAALRKQ